MVAIGIFAMSSLSFAGEAKDSVRIDLGLKMNQIYRNDGNGVFKSSVAEAIVNLKISGVSKSGEVIDYSSGDVSQAGESQSEIRLIDGQTIQLTDLKKGTIRNMKASISADSIVISSDEISQAIEADLKKQGDGLIKAMSLETDDGKLDYEAVVSDMSCSRTAKLLDCDLSATLVLKVEGK